MKCSCCGSKDYSNNLELARHIASSDDKKHKNAQKWADMVLRKFLSSDRIVKRSNTHYVDRPTQPVIVGSGICPRCHKPYEVTPYDAYKVCQC